MKYLKDAVLKLKGFDVEEEIETTIDIVGLFIPKEYIADDRTRLEIYKKISVLSTGRGVLVTFVDELIDRFSDFPDEVSNSHGHCPLKEQGTKGKSFNLLLRRENIG